MKDKFRISFSGLGTLNQTFHCEPNVIGAQEMFLDEI
jgi:hypothetical protein